MPLLQLKLIDFLNDMADPRKDALLNIYTDYNDIFHFAAGSSSKHQAWQGGYADHIAEILRINRATYQALSNIRPLPFTEDSALIALFFHDMEKPFKYGPKDNTLCKNWHEHMKHNKLNWHQVKDKILDEMQKDYHFKFSSDELNALQYTHGEGDDYSPTKRIASPLAAHVHHCDNTSARIWHSEGKGLS
ncbi:MAG: hypothetical protein ACI8QY_000534 [bacterium]|jgi:hypothetical protein